MKPAFLLKMGALIYLCSLGQVKRSTLYESTRNSLVVSVFNRRLGNIFFFDLFLVITVS